MTNYVIDIDGDHLPRLRNCKVWQDKAGDFFFQADHLDEYDPEHVRLIMKKVDYGVIDLNELDLKECRLERKDRLLRIIKDGQHRGKCE
jgi:hypothetical protein